MSTVVSNVARVIRRHLAASPFRQVPALAVAVIVDGQMRIVERGELANHLRQNDLRDLAKEVLATHVRAGEILLFISTDNADGTATSIATLNLTTGAVRS